MIKTNNYGPFEALCINNNTGISFSMTFATERQRWLYINKCKHGKAVTITGQFYKKGWD